MVAERTHEPVTASYRIMTIMVAVGIDTRGVNNPTAACFEQEPSWIRPVRGLQGWFTRLGVPAKASD